MSTSKKSQRIRSAAERRAQAQQTAAALKRQQRRRTIRNGLLGAVTGVAILGGLYVIFTTQAEPGVVEAQPADYEVGSPGPGEQAPDFALPGTAGEKVQLSDFRGESVLLYFHEGLGCQACWDQIRDLEVQSPQLATAGIDELVSITNASTDLLGRKMRDDGLLSLALADEGLAVIRDYEANKYGMMGDTRAGHTFVLVDADGKIVWRADYGGAPDYTMYVPVEKLLADLEAGRVDA